MGQDRTISWARARYSRRSVLRGAAGAGLGVVGIATLACSPATIAPTVPSATTGAAAPAQPSATTGVAAATASPSPKRGGAFNFHLGSTTDAPHLDIHQSAAAVARSYGPAIVYSQL